MPLLGDQPRKWSSLRLEGLEESTSVLSYEVRTFTALMAFDPPVLSPVSNNIPLLFLGRQV